MRARLHLDSHTRYTPLPAAPTLSLRKRFPRATLQGPRQGTRTHRGLRVRRRTRRACGTTLRCNDARSSSCGCGRRARAPQNAFHHHGDECRKLTSVGDDLQANGGIAQVRRSERQTAAAGTTSGSPAIARDDASRSDGWTDANIQSHSAGRQAEGGFNEREWPRRVAQVGAVWF